MPDWSVTLTLAQLLSWWTFAAVAGPTFALYFFYGKRWPEDTVGFLQLLGLVLTLLWIAGRVFT